MESNKPEPQTLALTFRLSKDSKTVFACLTDAGKFVAVHPLIYKMTPVKDGEYLVFERIMLGFIPCYFRYRATIGFNENKTQVHIKARVMGLVHIEMLFTLWPEGEGTRVQETVNLKSLLPVKSLMFKLFEKQHTLLFQNIENEGAKP